MDKTGKIILVQGATGQQGGATARHLLAQGWQVRALTRDPNKAAAQALKQAGADVVQGDNEDSASLEAAIKGVYGVFAVQNFWTVGPDGEERQGKLIADVAKANNVQHFVYTSVGGAERNTGIPHFESKWHIEQHIAALGLPATILRPVAFMENYNWSRPAILNGTFIGLGLPADKKNQLIAVDDVGAFAALAFEQPETYFGKGIELAGDELTEPEVAETLSHVISRPVQLGQMPNDPNQPPDPELLKMRQWFIDKGYEADIPALRKLYPPLKTLETWLRENGWTNAQPEPQAATSQWDRKSITWESRYSDSSCRYSCLCIAAQVGALAAQWQG
jgi:uncharacterized protein YbjT (DUF2867 family)